MAELLRRHRTELADTQAAVERERRAAADLAEAFALTTWRKFPPQAGDAGKVFWQVLAEAGVEVVTWLGHPVEDVEADADIVGWTDQAQAVPPGCVAETFEPELRFGGRIIHRAKLIGVRLEAPQDDAPQDDVLHETPCPDEAPVPDAEPITSAGEDSPAVAVVPAAPTDIPPPDEGPTLTPAEATPSPASRPSGTLRRWWYGLTHRTQSTALSHVPSPDSDPVTEGN
jgi:hypothetical protein